MDLFEAIMKRRSIRSFLPDEIPAEDIEKIIEAGTWAPSGSNTQPWKFIIIINEDIKKDLAKAVKEEVESIIEKEIKDEQEKRILRSYSKYFAFFHKSPAVLVVYGIEEQSAFLKTVNKYRTKENQITSASFIQSIAAAIQNICLAAEALGYGTCWMTGPLIAEKAIKKLLSMKNDDKIMAIIPIGKARVVPSPPKRADIKIRYI